MGRGPAEGITKGRQEKLEELVQKKLLKGKSISEIAEDLEEDVSVIEQFIKGSRTVSSPKSIRLSAAGSI